MSKKYIDFVPAKKGQGGARVATEVRPPRKVVTRPAVRQATMRPAQNVTAKPAQRVATKPAPAAARPSGTRVRVAPKVTTTIAAAKPAAVAQKAPAEKRPELGVIEDLSSKFVNTDVPKRPLSDDADAMGERAILASKSAAEAKAKKVKSKGVLRRAKSATKPVENPVENSAAKEASAAAITTYKTPKSPFINQNKVVKRPLSKNVYQKKVVTPKEVPQGPVTIIAKPEKDKHVGIIITIIITIILGATAGTVAFLLLPK